MRLLDRWVPLRLGALKYDGIDKIGYTKLCGQGGRGGRRI